jgi:hypothetical protein
LEQEREKNVRLRRLCVDSRLCYGGWLKCVKGGDGQSVLARGTEADDERLWKGKKVREL